MLATATLIVAVTAQVQFETTELSTNTGFPFGLAAIDVNEDGLLDLVAAAQNGNRLILYVNRGPDGFEPELLDAEIFAPGFMDVADLDQDGHLDLTVAIGGTGDLAVYYGNGSSLDKTALNENFVGGTTPKIADVDADGDLDILIASIQQDSVSWLEQTGPRSFVRRMIDSDLSGPIGLAVCDFDGNDRPDFAIADLPSIEAPDSVYAYVNDAGPFNRTALGRQNLGTTAVVCGDIDGDTDDDLVALSQFGDVSVFINQGLNSGELLRRADARPVTRGGTVALADVDSSGSLDIIATDFVERRIAFWINASGALEEFAFETIEADSGSDLVAADFNADRVPDLATVGTITTGGVQILTNLTPVPEGTPTVVTGAWLAPELAGQGLLFEYLPGNDQVFLAWFTFERESTAKVGSPGQRWLTGQLDLNDTQSAASGALFSTSGGRFDQPPGPDQLTEAVGGATLRFDACDRIAFSYSLPGEAEASRDLVPLASLTDPDFSCE